MEFWIFILITIVGILLISVLAFVIKCFGYKKVMKKMRTLSMSSRQDEDTESGRGSGSSSSRGQQNVVLPAPPAYAISFQHPVLARTPAVAPAEGDDSEERTGLEDPEQTGEQVVSMLTAPVMVQPGAFLPLVAGSAFPAESVFIPPPYCLDPPAYQLSEESGVCVEGSLAAPAYTA